MPQKAYKDLKDFFAMIQQLGSGASILEADSQTSAPPGARLAVSDIQAAMKEAASQLLRQPRIGDLVAQAESGRAHLSIWDQRNLDLMRRDWQQAQAVPPDLVREFSRAAGQCTLVWEEAKQKGSFKDVEECFKRLLFLTRDVAQAKRDGYLKDRSDYEALLDGFDPGRRTASIDKLFGELESFLPRQLDEIIELQKSKDLPKADARVARDAQLAVCRDLADRFGFDMNHGRLAEYTHPFSAGTPDYTWYTVAANEADFLSGAYTAAAHELGHALYTQGQPEDMRNQPVGDDAGIMIHETQSLIMERHVSMSMPFITGYLPRMKKLIGTAAQDWTAENVFNALHQVEKSFIRIEADQVSYPLHVILRYRLEKALIEGDLAIHDLPGAWNEMFKKLFGLTPPSDKEGCLQDIHWYSGGIGYFPSYTFGAVYGAQIFAAACEQTPDLMAEMGRANVQPLVQWLRENIHEQGRLYEPDDLIRRVTGKAPGLDDFKAHLTETYITPWTTSQPAGKRHA